MPSHDIGVLEKKIHAAHDTFAKLGRDSDFEELIKIIRRPGWTTPAEFLLVSSSLDALRAQGDALLSMRQELLKASREVGAKTAVSAS